MRASLFCCTRGDKVPLKINRLRELRTAAGLTQEEARVAGFAAVLSGHAARR